jgi:hypothetical protein
MLSLLISLIYCVVQQCPIPNELCIYGGRRGNNVVITVHSSSTGWVGIGTGQSMGNSQMIIGWEGPNGVVLSDRQSRGRTLPTPINTLSNLVPIQVPAPSWARLSFSLQRPVNNVMAFTPSTNFIYAYGDQKPQIPSNPQSSFPAHSRFGSFGRLDFTAEIPPPAPPVVANPPPPPPPSDPLPPPPSDPSVVPPPTEVTTNTSAASSSTSSTMIPTLTSSPRPSPNGTSNAILFLPAYIGYDSVLRIHAYAMIFSLLVCPFAGIFVARFMKEGILWLRIHVFIMVLAVVSAMLGISLVVLFKNGQHLTIGPDSNPHHLIGASIMVLLLAQSVLGYCAHKYYKQKTTTFDRLHWHLGRFVFIAIVTNFYFGIRFYESLYSFPLTITVISSSVVLIGFTSFFYGEIKYGYTSRQYQEPEMVISKPERYY